MQKIGIYVGVSNAIMFYELTHNEYKTEYKRKNNLEWVKKQFRVGITYVCNKSNYLSNIYICKNME